MNRARRLGLTIGAVWEVHDRGVALELLGLDGAPFARGDRTGEGASAVGQAMASCDTEARQEMSLQSQKPRHRRRGRYPIDFS